MQFCTYFVIVMSSYGTRLIVNKSTNICCSNIQTQNKFFLFIICHVCILIRLSLFCTCFQAVTCTRSVVNSRKKSKLWTFSLCVHITLSYVLTQGNTCTPSQGKASPKSIWYVLRTHSYIKQLHYILCRVSNRQFVWQRAQGKATILDSFVWKNSGTFWITNHATFESRYGPTLLGSGSEWPKDQALLLTMENNNNKI